MQARVKVQLARALVEDQRIAKNLCIAGSARGSGDVAGETLDSPLCVPSPTPLRRRLAFRRAPVQAGRGDIASEDGVIVIE